MKVPEGVQDLTAAWLTEALCPTGTVTQARVISDDGEGIEAVKGVVGETVRLHLTYDVDETDAPSSLIAKLSAANPATRTGFCNSTLPRYCAAILDLHAGELLSEDWL